ncbi:MAG: MTH1187 family thiamine-binding protein [Calditerrivibrio sp.]|uniref:MTH1187 family thiamine-binding protein n=1 Tax=Calditerrivibrio sp. TaxID=2792612 RepID=UPI003D12CE7B
MSFLVEFAMFPTDKGESVSNYVSRIIKMIDGLGIPYKLTPMGTVFEANSMEEALEIINIAYKQLEPDCNRIYTAIKMDIRKGAKNRMEGKIKSLEEKLNKKIRS